jgi:hypothetical protein
MSRQVSDSDFHNFKVSDGPEPCCSCSPTPTNPPAPVVINGKHYCVWCALEIARALTVPRIVAE